MSFKKAISCIALCVFSAGASAHAVKQYRVQAQLSPDGNVFVLARDAEVVDASAARTGVHRTELPLALVEGEARPHARGRFIELSALDPQALEAALRALSPGRPIVEHGRSFSGGKRRALDETRTLVANGPSANRIDLVFMGDGYTATQRDLFFADAARLTKDLFEGPTFKSYLPAFNVHAVFRASNAAGIGVGGVPKDTAYRLYREGRTLRAIYPGDPSAARESCRAAPGCDYPILMANDPYYGGLGGEFAITTSSPTSGTVVLRHELGHNFGRVGEEYDGGGYFGANQAGTLGSVGWAHWLTGPLRAEPAQARVLQWPWKALTEGPFRASFRGDGRFATSAIRFSASGMHTVGAVRVSLDGKVLAEPLSRVPDRSFLDLKPLPPLAAGTHELVVDSPAQSPAAMLSNITLHEYAADFNGAEGAVSAYPNFAANGRVDAYRPTNEGCLMRDMLRPTFCRICQENNWLQFFARISPIDGVDVANAAGKTRVTVRTLSLGRNEGAGSPRIALRWFRNGVEVESLRDKPEAELPQDAQRDRWEVEARFLTPEVRADPRGLLTRRARFQPQRK